MAIPQLFSVGSFLCLVLSFSLLAGGCKSPEQLKAERAEKLKTFASQVSKRLLDRNPATLRESVNILRAQELTEEAITKLEKQEVIPSAGLDVLKEIQIAEDNKTTNVVEVTSVTPLGPIDKDVVPLKVTGRNILKKEGRPDVVQPFSLTVTAKLTEQMAGYPMAVNVEGLKASDFMHHHLDKKDAPKEAKGSRRRK